MPMPCGHHHPGALSGLAPGITQWTSVREEAVAEGRGLEWVCSGFDSKHSAALESFWFVVVLSRLL